MEGLYGQACKNVGFIVSDVVYFYVPSDAFGPFSNFSIHGVELDGKWWRTVEHYFQAQKFKNKKYQEKIRKAWKPKMAASLGRSRKQSLRLDWEEVKDDIMRKVVLKKFQTHLEPREMLLSTQDRKIVEAAPGDYYWGCGANGNGKNMLGKILMETRKTIRMANESID